LELEKLYAKYADKGLAILAFPCNGFGGQEPDELPVILATTAKKFGRTFPLQGKVEVSGPKTLTLFSEVLNVGGKEITWNFHKFLVDKHGVVTGSYKPKVGPLEMESDIVKLLQ
jgi:glutathione peroxidase